MSRAPIIHRDEYPELLSYLAEHTQAQAADHWECNVQTIRRHAALARKQREQLGANVPSSTSRPPSPPPPPPPGPVKQSGPVDRRILDMLLKQNLERLALARQHEAETGEPHAQTTAISREIQRILVATGQAPAPPPQTPVSGLPLCPHCSSPIDPSTFPGFYLPPDSTVDDVQPIYRFVGCVDLGQSSASSAPTSAATHQSQRASRGAPGSSMRSAAQSDAPTGRTQARTLRDEEHA